MTKPGSEGVAETSAVGVGVAVARSYKQRLFHSSGDIEFAATRQPRGPSNGLEQARTGYVGRHA